MIGDSSGYQLKRGFFKGESSPTNEILAAGWGIKEKKMLTVFDPVGDSDSIQSRNYSS